MPKSALRHAGIGFALQNQRSSKADVGSFKSGEKRAIENKQVFQGGGVVYCKLEKPCLQEDKELPFGWFDFQVSLIRDCELETCLGS